MFKFKGAGYNIRSGCTNRLVISLLRIGALMLNFKQLRAQRLEWLVVSQSKRTRKVYEACVASDDDDIYCGIEDDEIGQKACQILGLADDAATV